MPPRWTVLLPTHNSAATLGLAIDSVLAQSDTDFELLIVGDGVGDDTRAVVAEHSDPRLRFIDAEKAPGFGYQTRRIVLETATGELVAFVSDDDLIGPDHLSLLGAQLAQHDLAYSRPMWCVPSGEIVPLSVDLTDPTIAALFEQKNFVPSTFWALRRTALERAGGWPVHVEAGGDWHLWRAVLALPQSTVGYVPAPTALHFRAARRSSDHEAVAAILALPDRQRWWPPAAVLETGTQQAAHDAAQHGGWWQRLAAAVTAIEHHLAFTFIDARVHPVEPPEVEIARQQVRDLYEGSRSWRLTRFLRRR